MPLSGTPAPPNKRKKTARIITDLSHITQDEITAADLVHIPEYESEPEASEFDLGTKISTPKDIMLEELSLMKNKGSKMFKMRQLRVEKFIWENNPDVFTSDSMDNLQKFIPSIGGQMMDVGGRLVKGQMVGGYMVGHAGKGGQAPVPPPKPGSLGAGAGIGGTAGGSASGGAGGAGGAKGSAGLSVNASQSDESGKAGSGKKADTKVHVKTYVSPWERAMKGNADLVATMKTSMPGPCGHGDLPKYKSFNRTAMPFGGFEKASQLMTFQLPDIEVVDNPEPPVVYQHDINSRPSFNRTPIGWVGSGETSNIHMEMETVPFDGETDDL